VYFIGNLRPREDSLDHIEEPEFLSKLAPMAMGSEFLMEFIAPETEIAIDVRWAFYYRFFPTLEQQREVQATQSTSSDDSDTMETGDTESAPQLADSEASTVTSSVADSGDEPSEGEDVAAAAEEEQEQRQLETEIPEIAETAQDRRRKRAPRDSLFIRYRRIDCHAASSVTLRRDSTGSCVVDATVLQAAITVETERAKQVALSDPDAVRAQVARALSLDQDARAFVTIGDRDPVMARLLAAAPGLRPPLFYSPYEAAAWCVLSARRPAAQMSEVRRRLSEEHGRVFEVAGEPVAALPTPEQLLGVTTFPGIPEVKMRRLHLVAEAALRGGLDCRRLRGMDPDAAMLDLQRLEGIGPFYSALIVIRATGHTDVLPENEPRALALAGELYGLGHAATRAEMRELSEQWRPFRTWAVVLLRAAGERLRQRVDGLIPKVVATASSAEARSEISSAEAVSPRRSR